MNRHYLGILILVLLLAGCSAEPRTSATAEVQAEAPLPVESARAETREVEQYISLTGSLQADETATVSNEVEASLAVLHVDFGQRVRKGQPIAELDTTQLALQHERAKAALHQALARVGLTPERADETPADTPMIRQAQAQLEDARTKFESAKMLIKTGDIAQDRYVEIEKAYNAREAAVDAARHELRVLLASIESLKAEVAMAQERLDDAVIRAPFDGSVAERMASPGEYLRQNTPIVRLVKTYPLRLRVDIPESAAAAAQVGQKLTFTTSGILGETFEAVVREVNPSLDPRSRSLAAEARLVKHDSRLRPGMFVQVRMVTNRSALVVVVPRNAIYSVAGLTKVFTLRGGKAIEHKILRGQEYEGWVEVQDSDVMPGDRVAVSELAELYEGKLVEPRDSQS